MKKAILWLSAAIIFIAGIFWTPLDSTASNEEDVLAYMNSVRQEAGLDAFIWDQDLSDVAAIRAQECSVSFSHTRPNGKAWSTVSSLTNGENLAHAINYNQQKPENVVLAWTLSSKHYANLVRQSFSYVGIAYYCNDNGETFIACEFR